MLKRIEIDRLTAGAFAPFGDVLSCEGEPDKIINQGMCGRFHDLASLQLAQRDPGRFGVSLFNAEPRTLPYRLNMVERHPLGSQCFVPMTEHPFLVIVAEDENGKPKQPIAFITTGVEAINFHANVWHGVLTPLTAPGRFAVIDRIGDGDNLEEFWFDEAFEIVSV
ncbi:MAG: ureidoglycolate lyase [Pseudomonadota bacterium]